MTNKKACLNEDMLNDNNTPIQGRQTDKNVTIQGSTNVLDNRRNYRYIVNLYAYRFNISQH